MATPEITSIVSKVTVYTDRAMVTRTARTHVEPRTKSIQITDLPANLQEETLRIGGRGATALSILDFKVTRHEYKEVPVAALKTLEEEKQRFADQIAALRDEIATIEHQKGFLKEIGVGKSKHFSKDLDVQRPLLDDWKAVLEFLGKEQRDLDGARREIELKIRKLELDVRMIDAELKKHGAARVKVRKTVTIALEAKGEGDYEFELSYLVHEANWVPMYDARVDSRAKQVGMRYYGLVNQRTGEDWKGVEVLLSTARPQIDGNVPALEEWTIEPYPIYALAASAAPRGGLFKKKAMASADMAFESGPEMEEEEYGGGGRAEAAVHLDAAVEAGQGASVVFRTAGRGDVPGDGSAAKLLIMDGDFVNRFRYLSVPKLAEFVYLTADVTNSTEYPLLPGRISIFLDGNFVGNSDLRNLITPTEKFELHLGVDESIKVRRKLQKHKGDEKGLFSRSHTEEFSYLITLESHRETAEEVILRDQLPVSSDEKIKVEVRTITPAENPEKDKDKLSNGVVEWKINLAPKAVEKLELGFVVSHPKEMQVLGL